MAIVGFISLILIGGFFAGVCAWIVAYEPRSAEAWWMLAAGLLILFTAWFFKPFTISLVML